MLGATAPESAVLVMMRSNCRVVVVSVLVLQGPT